ncbi:MAG: leucine-rich repeat domain-containing protein, partial [Anaerolineaceae bacterium]|nr:leucine-rich repeat domain-containing protein [Anaerolineaceae bacterium]
MIKKITIILVCVLILAVGVKLLIDNGVISGIGGSGEPRGGGMKWVYEVSDGNVILTAYNGRESNPEIPSTLENLPVTTLSDSLFANNTKIREVRIPESVTSIGQSIFENCTDLTTVTLSPNLTRIPNKAFSGCKNLAAIQIPEEIKSIGTSAFSGCAALTSVTFPNSVTTIGADAFLNCSSLAEVNFTRFLSSLGSHAFKGTAWLSAQNNEFVIIGNQILVKYNGISDHIQVPLGVTQITDAFEDNLFPIEIELPSSLTSIGPRAFSGCRSLETVNIPESVRSIGDSAFKGCSHLSPIVLPNRVSSIGASAFQSCSALERMVIPNGVKTLPKLVLANCEKLQMVQIPESVTSIASDIIIYSGVTELRIVKGTAGESFAIENNIPYAYEQRSNEDFIYQQLDDGVQVIMYTGSIYDVVIPEELSGDPVTSLSDILFQHNSLVRTVDLPDTITRIPDYSFANMSDLRSVKFPQTLTEIGYGAFSNDPMLGELEIPDSVTSIMDDAFDGCPSLVILASEGSYAFDWAIKAGIRVKDNKLVDSSLYRFIKPEGQVLVSGYDGMERIPELPRMNDYDE